jgi:hypothetical protein
MDGGTAHARQESDKVALEPMGSNTAEVNPQDDGSLSPTSLEDGGGAKQIQYLTGIRFHLIIAACVFLDKPSRLELF